MPRKTRKPRKARTLSLSTDQLRRQAARAALTPQSQRQDAAQPRRRRPDLRPPKFPGRLGGR